MKWMLVFTLFLLLPSSYAVVINEIMYDPAGTDTGREWVEAYSDGSCENISQWKFFESNINHTLILTQGDEMLCLGEYAIITYNSTTFLSEYGLFNITIFNSTTFSLVNSGEVLALKNSSLNIVDLVNYSNYLFANGSNKSIEKINTSWFESLEIGGTPGRNNTAINQTGTGQGLELTVYASSPLYLGTTYDDLFKIENLGHISGTTDNINVTIYYNITNSTNLIKQDTFYITGLNQQKTANTGEFTPNATGNFTICGRIVNSTIQDNMTSDDHDCKTVEVIDPSTIPCNITLTVDINQTIWTLGQTIKFYNLLNNDSFPYAIEYWIEDLFGDIVKSKINTSTQTQKSWTPSITEEDRAFVIKNRLVWLACNDSNQSDNSGEQLIAVKGQLFQPEPNSYIDIKEAENETRFGDVAYVEVNIYKGDTAAYAITADIGSASEETKFYAYTKYTNYSLKLPIQTYDNCDKKYSDGFHTLAVSGLGKSDSAQIMLYGKADYCGSSSSSNSSTSSSSASSRFRYELVKNPEKIISGKEFTSEVKIESDKEDHELEIYSYIYRGSKSYSGNRDGNRQHVLLEADSSVIVELKNTAYVAEEGNYSFKIKIKKDDLKTEKEITVPIYISIDENIIKTTEDTIKTKSIDKKETDVKSADWYFNRVDEPVTVFLSPSYKAKRAMIYGLLGLSVLLSITMILIKKNLT